MRILGLDIGINSIGWALVEQDTSIIDCGVRIFPVGVKEDDYNKSGSEISKNAARRLARSIRRGYFRYKLRRKVLFELLDNLHMLPDTSIMHMPSKALYGLRKMALDEQISLQEIGRIFLLLNQRRGFKSSKKDKGSETAKERSEIKLMMKELELAMIDNNCGTIGEYFYLLFLKNAEDPNCFNPDAPIERIRKKHVDRKLYSAEFDRVWETQRAFYPDVLTDENKKRIKDECIYYQRPLKSQKHLVGHCRLEPQKKCCPISSFEFQEFRIWQVINNIRVTDNEQFRQSLSFEQKESLFAVLNATEMLTHAQIKTALGISKRANFNDLPEKIKGNSTNARIAKAIGKEQYYALDEAQRRLLWHTLLFASDEDWLYQYAKDKLQFSDEQALDYAAVHLEEGYSSVSSKALLKGKETDVAENGLLFHLKKGLDYAEAAQQAGYHHSYNAEEDNPARVLLDKIVIDSKDHIRNPLVQQCISESARLVNAIIKKYGRPDMIRVEMARSLKKPKSEREKIKRRNDETDRRRDEYRDFLKRKLGKEHVSKTELVKFELFLEMQYAADDLRKLNGQVEIEEFTKFAENVKSGDKAKYELWLECGRISPYSGKVISLSQLFSSEIDIEHIVPYSRCMNDSFANKTLCERSINEEKSNRTPYEYLGHDKHGWAEFKQRVKYFGDRKQEQFMRQELPDDFLNSQLNNTAYVARETIKHFKTVCKDVAITNGQATSYLRRFWGLNDLLNPEGINEKSRHDHRHHTIDAIVIAFTSRRYIQLLSSQSQFDGLGKMRVPGVTFPYPSFKLDVNEKLHRIFVSYRNKKRLLNVKTNKYIHSKNPVEQKTFQVRGSLHEETNYGRIKHPTTGEFEYVVRKPITAIENEKHIEKVVDVKIREMLRDHIADHPGTVKQAMAQPLFFITKNGKRVPINKVRMIDNSENLIQIRPNENSKLFVASGNNYCIAIFEDSDGNREFETVSFYDAVKRKKAGLPVIPLSKNDKKLLFSLKQKDMILLYDNHPDEIDWNDKRDLFERLCRVIKFDVVGQIFFGRHTISKIDSKTDRNINLFQQRVSTMKAVKVNIDTLGSIIKA